MRQSTAGKGLFQNILISKKIWEKERQKGGGCRLKEDIYEPGVTRYLGDCTLRVSVYL